MENLQIIRKRQMVYLLVLVALIANGCAFGARNIALNPVNIDNTYNLSGKKFLLSLTDNRDTALKPVVGHVKNGYGMKTAEVLADKDASLWVKENIEKELIRNGATTLQSIDKNVADNKIDIELLVCYAQAYWNYGAEVKAKASLTNTDKVVILNKEYSGKATLGTNWAAAAESYQKVLELAMKNFLEKMMPDLYPLMR